MNVPISYRILIVFLIVNLSTSGFLVYVSYSYMQESIERQLRENVTQQVAQISARFDNEYTFLLRRTIRTQLNLNLFDDFLRAPKIERLIITKELERWFIREIESNKTLHAISFVRHDGSVAVKVEGTRRVLSSANLRKIDSASDETTPEQHAASRLFNRLANIPLLLSAGNMEWFMPVRHIQVEGPFKDSDGDYSIIGGLAKLDVDTREFGGAVLVQQKISHFLNSLREVKLFGENPFWVLGPHDEVIQQPGKSDITFNPSSYLDATARGAPKLVELEKGLVAFQDIVIRPGELLLRVVAAVPSSLILKDFTPAIRFFTLVLAISAVVAFVIAFSVSHYFSRPIKALASAASKLGRGDLKSRVNAKTGGELRILVDTFNHMAESLCKAIEARDQSMERLVKEAAERERLTEATLVAEAADRAKSEILARMSHEMRTPMNGVLGIVDILYRTSLTIRQRNLVNIIKRSAGTLLNIVNDILDLSRIEAGRLHMDSTRFCLRDAVSDVAELLAETVASKNLELFSYISEDLPAFVRGDPNRLGQVLFNLVGNAVKFTENGEVLVRIVATHWQTDEVRVRFEIRDTGPGISDKARRKLFTPFFQADASITRRFGGTGLGLSIAQHIVKAMGGQIEVESVEGQGSTFWFEIPLTVEASDEIAGPDHELTGQTVLIIAAGATNRQVLSGYCEAWGAQCSLANNLTDADAWLRRTIQAGGQCDLIVCDVPEYEGAIDGYVRNWRVDGVLRDTKLVQLLSVNSERLSMGVDSDNSGTLILIAKPFHPYFLRGEINRLLNIQTVLPQNPAELPSADETIENSKHLKGLTILLAEDNPVNLEITTDFLLGFGCRVRSAADGRSALDLIERHAFDAVLMDCQMPIMDGLEATRKIRELPDVGDIPIIALTASAYERDRQACLTAGMNDYLSKPFTRKELFDAISKHIAPRLARGDIAEVKDQAVNRDIKLRIDDIMSYPIFDEAVLQTLRQSSSRDGNVLISRLVSAYLASASDLIKAIINGLSKAEADNVILPAHTLKSASSNLGLVRLSALCSLIEQIARENSHSNFTPLTALFEEEAAQSIAVLTENTYSARQRIVNQ